MTIVVVAFVIIVVIVAIAVSYVTSVAIFDQTMFFFLFGFIASQMACAFSSCFHCGVSSAGIVLVFPGVFADKADAADAKAEKDKKEQ